MILTGRTYSENTTGILMLVSQKKNISCRNILLDILMANEQASFSMIKIHKSILNP